VLAVAVARLAPGPPFGFQHPDAQLKSSDALIDAFLVSESHDGILRLDPETGRLEPVALPLGESLFRPSFSPHRDDRHDGAQAAGVSFDRASGEYFLARVLLPGGEVLGRVPAPVLPIGSLCWDPMSRSRVLFASGDGKLFCIEIATTEEGAIQPSVPPPVSWASGLAPGAYVVPLDPCWPADARLGGRVMVSLRRRQSTGTRVKLTPARLWWLKLDPHRATIVEAGPLEVQTQTSVAGDEDWDVRYPSFAATTEGALLIAYQIFRRGRSTGELQVAPLRIDPRTGAPSMLCSESVTVGDGCVRMPAVFSRDGRRIAFLKRSGQEPATAQSVELPLSLCSSFVSGQSRMRPR
jgi:hypothetical protein